MHKKELPQLMQCIDCGNYYGPSEVTRTPNLDIPNVAPYQLSYTRFYILTCKIRGGQMTVPYYNRFFRSLQEEITR